MSTPCDHSDPGCRCDQFEHPQPLRISAGLDWLPRQIATFPEFRRAMLAAIPQHPALAHWRARGDDDLGVMLLEMWAYVCDALTFYDEVLANESYVRTAQQRTSLRKLITLLGYVPRPAVAAMVQLVIEAEGRHSVTLPPGTAFRSEAFDDEPPQVFELEAAATVHPLLNHWDMAAAPNDTITGSDSATLTTIESLLFEPGTVTLREGDVVMLRVGGDVSTTQVSQVDAIADETGLDGGKYNRITFDPALSLPGNTAPADVKVHSPAQEASLWTLAALGSNPAAIADSGSVTKLTLDGLYRQIKAGQHILVNKGSHYRWFKVTQVSEYSMQVTEAEIVEVTNSDGDTADLAVPAVSVPATQLLLDAHIDDADRKGTDSSNWAGGSPGEFIVLHQMVKGGKVVTEDKTTLGSGDALQAQGRPETPRDGSTSADYVLLDKDGVGMQVGGSLNFTTGAFTPDQGTQWPEELLMPVTLYGNLVTATRGETVASEVLGSGDASQANQFFKLKKAPLMYTSAPSSDHDQGVVSSLEVYVNGIRWSEATTFFHAGPEDQVYIVRQNDDGDSIVTFGDGVRGARLPTGVDNVIATYRHGAGAASPPAGGITQIAKPVKGLRSVKNPIAAYGGGDAESSDELRTLAPESALLLGRAVSIQDYGVVARQVPGVRAATAEWRWHDKRQRPLVQVWYIGAAELAATVLSKLQAISDPSVVFDVDQAVSVPLNLTLDLEIDDRYIAGDVLAAVEARLLDPDSGLLPPERIGINTPLYRSRIFEAALAVPGVVAVAGLLLDGAPFDEFGIVPGDGAYFDIESGALNLSGKAVSHG